MASESCYCAFCKHERKVYTKKHIGPVNIFLVLLSSVLLSFIVWQGFDPRVSIVFCSGIVVSEIFVTIRWRVTMPCPYCGFDPVLYMKNPKKASSRVKGYIEEQKKSSDFYFRSKNPLKYLHTIKKDPVKDEAKIVLEERKRKILKQANSDLSIDA